MNTKFPIQLIVSTILLICFHCQNGTAQTIIINSDDSTLTRKYMREFWSPSKHDVFFKSGSHFKDSLPDGTYYYIPKRKKKEKKTSVEDLYESKGQYVNSVPSGRFEYYSLCSFSKRKRDIRVLTAEENYKDGLLHGYSFCGTCEFKLYEGNFKMGKRHGFFYEYDFFGNLILVELYQEGVLIHRSELRDITILKK